MANEILKDEMMNEEELDKVAGGTYRQIASDSQFLRDSGLAPELKGWGNYDTEHQFKRISGLVTEAWAKAGITCTPSFDGENGYSFDGKEISREDAYKIVADAKNFKFNYHAYGLKHKI